MFRRGGGATKSGRSTPRKTVGLKSDLKSAIENGYVVAHSKFYIAFSDLISLHTKACNIYVIEHELRFLLVKISAYWQYVN